MLPKYKGSVSINNNEIRNKPDHFYESIGVDFEFPSFYEKFTALENLNSLALYMTASLFLPNNY